VRRGEVWTVAGGAEYAGKPRPAAVIQDDRFGDIESIAVCPLTTNKTSAQLFRLLVEPTGENGLEQPSCLMIDKVATVPRSKLGRCIGRLDDATMLRLNRAIAVFLGLAGGSG
jgi:mRNA interferase MazF